MGFFLFLLINFCSCTLICSLSYLEFVYPNFTASNLQFVEKNGAFLFSRNGTFKAAMFNPQAQQLNFYLCVIHVASNTIVWSANRDSPVSNSGKMNLTAQGITIVDEDGFLKWSAPQIQSPVNVLTLTEMGNLILLDRSNASLWQSFDYPTDTIVMGQYLLVGASLVSAASATDLSPGDYSLVLSSSASSAVLLWHGQTYWKLSMESRAYINSNSIIEYMSVNRTGLYLLGRNGTVVVISLTLPPSNFRIATVDSSGTFLIQSFSNGGWNQDFVGPSDSCRIPFICGRIGSCADNSASGSPVCSCPTNFHSQNSSGCIPSNGSYSLYSACNITNSTPQVNSSAVSYLPIGYGYDYFANQFLASPARNGVNLSTCQSVCSGDCSCLGVLYKNSSGDCYQIAGSFGSLISGGTEESFGYVKVLVGSSPPSSNNNGSQDFPLSALVLLPSSAFCLVLILGLLFWRKHRNSKMKEVKLGRYSFRSSDELDAFDIPGLPRRFNYKELEIATDNFKIHIGSGGFGTVYKGVLPDETLVAVKKITNLGVQGRRDFCTEIAVIGNVHHINLVKLRGFCAQGACLLVYEYMNRGSLDRILFGIGPVLEWQERFDVALGTARGLVYLHCGCDQKIIHCDIKPENILLHDNFQAKISDFGLSKLLSPEQSGLFTTMRGTRGYLAPEWLTNSSISEKTDVYSFGMVLLELVSGRKNCMVRTQTHGLEEASSGTHSTLSSGSGVGYFPLVALEMHEQGKYLELVDPRLENRVVSEDVEKLVRVALCCVHEEPHLRPSMVSVVGMLEGGIPLGQPRVESLNFLRFYGRRFTEASLMEERNVMLYSQANASLTSTNSSSHRTLSYISSQQVSGPR